MSGHEDTLVAGVLQQPSRITLLSSIDSSLFEETGPKKLFAICQGFCKKKRGKNFLDFSLMRSILDRKGREDLADIVDEYQGLAAVSDSEFKQAKDELVECARRRQLKKAASEALKASLDNDWDEAYGIFRRGITGIEDVETEDYPLDLRSSHAKELGKERVSQQQRVVIPGFNSGFPFIAENVTLKRKDLSFLAGFSSDGKSTFARTLLYNFHTLSNAKCFFVQLEMTVEQTQVLILAQHASTLNPRGFSPRAIMDGTESKEDRELYLKALDDFEFRTHEDTMEVSSEQGYFQVWAPRKRISCDRYFERARAVKEEDGLDVLGLDYSELLDFKASKQYRLELKDFAEDSKMLARELDVHHMILHQISRKGREAAEKRGGFYVKEDLGESSGIERSADVIIWVMSTEAGRHDMEAKVGICKARMGSTLTEGQLIYANYAKGIMGPKLD